MLIWNIKQSGNLYGVICFAAGIYVDFDDNSSYGFVLSFCTSKQGHFSVKVSLELESYTCCLVQYHLQKPNHNAACKSTSINKNRSLD